MHNIRKILIESLELKNLPRSGWLQNQISNCESVAAHSWGVSWLATVLCPSDLDIGIVTQMAIVHDLAEVRVGDLTPNDNISKEKKHDLEYSSMQDILSNFQRGEELFAIWLEYEAQESPESNFVKACDKLDMALQAQYYMIETGKDLNEFIDSALAVITENDMRILADFNRYQY